MRFKLPVLSRFTTADNRRKPQIFGEEREGTVLNAVETQTFRKTTAAFRRRKYLQNRREPGGL